MNCLVSVLVPIYGVEEYIEKCTRSLFEQTYDNIEYVFVDACTTDNSIIVLRNVLENYPKRKGHVKIVKHAQNKGLSGARNTAIANATGEYLLHVDSDDYLDLNVVECLINKAQREDADVVVYDMKYIYTDKCFKVSQSVKTDPKEYLKQLLTYDISVCVCGKLYKSSMIKDNNIQFIEGLNFGEDYVTSPRVAYYAHRIAHCIGAYYNYVQYNASSYTNFYRPKNVDDLLRAIEILSDFFRNKKDYGVYVDTLNKSKLLNKIKLLIAVCLNSETVGYRFHEVCGLYNDIDAGFAVGISLNYRLILFFARNRMYNILKMYIVGGFKLKQTIKRFYYS